nr:katanin p60 ATPase-containing subunit A-like 2 isoform X2 [Tanacetum cinerariifolium]
MVVVENIVVEYFLDSQNFGSRKEDTPIVIDKLVRVTFAFQKEDTVVRKNLSFVNLGVFFSLSVCFSTITARKTLPSLEAACAIVVVYPSESVHNTDVKIVILLDQRIKMKARLTSPKTSNKTPLVDHAATMCGTLSSFGGVEIYPPRRLLKLHAIRGSNQALLLEKTPHLKEALPLEKTLLEDYNAGSNGHQTHRLHTMLAKAVATECNTTFFNISASSIVSKWRGDSEKLVKVLFELARHHAPSTIFLDEIDAIISQRGESRSEHESSRRLKTELLIQMDGLTKTDELVFVLAATNLPWELDAAMLRRLEKRILVPLPEPEARKAMFEELLPSVAEEERLPYDLLVEKTQGFSGSDIRLLCKEAAMQPLRRVMAILEQQDMLPDDELPKIGPIKHEDIQTAIKNTRPSAHLHAPRYEKFNEDYGSQILQ